MSYSGRQLMFAIGCGAGVYDSRLGFMILTAWCILSVVIPEIHSLMMNRVLYCEKHKRRYLRWEGCSECPMKNPDPPPRKVP